MRLFKWYQKILSSKPFTKYRLMTNVLVGIAGDTVGDCLTQKLERAKINDWNRSGRMGIMGGVLSVPYHHWYIYLDKLFPTNKAKDVAKKVLLDTTVMGPFYITGFYTGMSKLEGKTWKEAYVELKDKFLITFIVDCTFWPAIQTINFFFIPISLRFVFSTSASVVWAMVLSAIKHRDYHSTEIKES